MRVLAGLELDASVGPLASSAIAEVVGSPGAVLGLLETALGLTAPAVTLAERAAWLLPRLKGTEGYWSASAVVDAWGTALRLVHDRDALTMEGWRGEPVSPRWDALWSITDGIPPGLGDRWAAAADAIGTRRLDLREIVLVDPRREWPGAIRNAFARLQSHGVEVREEVPGPAEARGDLAAARSGAFVPAGDGSLQLVRAQGASAAAEDLAAWLAEHGDIDTTIIVNADATLDAALRRAGLPTTGAQALSGAGRDAALQILPRVLDLQWTPADPQAALDLLCLPATPIPAALARRLADALRRWPALGSEEWDTALAEHDYGSDPEQATRRRTRVLTLLTPDVARDRDAVAVDALVRRIEVSAAWVRARAHADNESDPAPWHRAATQHRTLRRLLRDWNHPEIAASLLARFIDAATDAAGGSSPWPAQARLRSVGGPGGVIRPVDTIVWWGFSRETAPAIRELGLTRDEHAALAAAGVDVPSAGDRATWAARRWRRPLSMARTRLLLIAPRSSAPGEAVHPHPLWDEISATIPEADRGRLAASLQFARPGLADRQRATRHLAVPLALPTYTPAWHVAAGSLAPRERESPSGLGALVGCSLRWALRYPMRVPESHATFRLGVGARELGNLAHEVLAEVMREGHANGDAAAARAGAVFDGIGPRRLAPLFLPGGDADREDIRGKIVRSAHAVVTWMEAHGLKAIAVEEDLEREFEGRSLRGRVDLMAGEPRVVVDFKLGGREKRRTEIARGTAYQLATYAHAAAGDREAMPEYAYFIVVDQLMVGRTGGPFDENTTVAGPTPQQTWERFANACRHRLAEVAAGTLRAPGALRDVPVEPIVDGDRLALPPGCMYCSYDALCGKAFFREDPA